MNEGFTLMKKWIFWTVLVLLLYGFIEIGSLIGIIFLKKFRNYDYAPINLKKLDRPFRKSIQNVIDGNTHYYQYHSKLGWTIKSDGVSPDRLYRANSKGIRSSREFTITPPPEKVRIASFGDSFTHGDDVSNEDTWQENLNRNHPELEVINFGVSGYGLDQTYLRYLSEGITYHPDIVLICFLSENIARSTNVFRPFYTPSPGLPFTKPRFRLENNNLVLVENPFQDVSQYQDLLNDPKRMLGYLGKLDTGLRLRYKTGTFDFLPSVRLFKIGYLHFIKEFDDTRPVFKKGVYNRKTEEYKITVRLFDEFVHQVSQNGSLPIIVIFPLKAILHQYRREGIKEYAPLLEHFNEKGYLYIDMIEGFEFLGKDIQIKDFYFGHFSPIGNNVVAEYIAYYLQKNNIFHRESIHKATSQLPL